MSIRDSTNTNFKIKENGTFGETIVVSKSDYLFNDTFPTFVYDADGPKLLWHGGTSNSNHYKIGTYTDSFSSKDACNNICKNT